MLLVKNNNTTEIWVTFGLAVSQIRMTRPERGRSSIRKIKYYRTNQNFETACLKIR
jgi:hypothetical protein